MNGTIEVEKYQLRQETKISTWPVATVNLCCRQPEAPQVKNDSASSSLDMRIWSTLNIITWTKGTMCPEKVTSLGHFKLDSTEKTLE